MPPKCVQVRSIVSNPLTATMMKKAFSRFLLIALVALTACDPDTTNLDIVGMVAGSSPCIDKRFRDSQAYNDAHPFVTLAAPADTYHLYVCTDTHVDSTRRNWEYFIRQYRNDSLCPVAIHLGDLINAQNHFAFMAAALTDIPRTLPKTDTLMAVVGNHDIYFNQWSIFLKYWHTGSYYFLVQTPSGERDFFLVLDTSEGTLGSRQLAWLREVLSWADGQAFRHRIVCTHTSFFKRDTSQGHTSNMPLEETYTLLNLFQKHHIEMLWTGHDHSREVTQVKSLTCIIVDSMEDIDTQPAYMLVRMGAQIDYDFVAVPRL